MKVFIAAIILAIAGPAWSQNEIERDLDGNASVFQTTEATKKTGGADARR